VLLWPDTWNNYFHPQVLGAAHEVLTSAGFQVQVPAQHICCGRPLYDFGFLDQARAYLLGILERLGPQIDSGIPFVVLEPSCASVFRDELTNFFPANERAQRLAKQTFLLSEVLAHQAPGYRPPNLAGRQMVLHGHCHQKAMMGMQDELGLLVATDATVNMLDSGCCGMAGPFGFEKDKFEVSQALGERVLLPAVRAAGPETILVTDGFSCREQIRQNSPRHAVHLAEVLAGRC
jgi:Fe-S oxidoreductase